ncbi:MAG: hypothetical protein Q9188_005105, partial [Gyalolechia gomerana]
ARKSGNGGAWEIDEHWHPVKDGKCYHVGVCEVMVKEWRTRAGLEVDEEEPEEEVEREREEKEGSEEDDERQEWFSCDEGVES